MHESQDTRPEPAPANIVFNGTLRPEFKQPEAFAAMTTHGHLLAALDCGFGKTTISLAVAAHFKLRTMIVVHKEVRETPRTLSLCDSLRVFAVPREPVARAHQPVLSRIQGWHRARRKGVCLRLRLRRLHTHRLGAFSLREKRRSKSRDVTL